MHCLWDKLVIVHADISAIANKKNVKEVDIYIWKIRELVRRYVYLNREVFFTRIYSDDRNVSYLDDISKRIIWVPRNMLIKNVPAQIDFIVWKLPWHKKHHIEFAWWREWACYDLTVSWILWVAKSLIEEKEENWIISYKRKDWISLVTWVARRELIF